MYPTPKNAPMYSFGPLSHGTLAHTLQLPHESKLVPLISPCDAVDGWVAAMQRWNILGTLSPAESVESCRVIEICVRDACHCGKWQGTHGDQWGSPHPPLSGKNLKFTGVFHCLWLRCRCENQSTAGSIFFFGILSNGWAIPFLLFNIALLLCTIISTLTHSTSLNLAWVMCEISARSSTVFIIGVEVGGDPELAVELPTGVDRGGRENSSLIRVSRPSCTILSFK